MKIKKLNDDSSWLWCFDDIKLMVDPWFSPSQVDLHPLFSEQFHCTEQPAVNQLERPDYLFISHPFTDHCNKETLLQFDPTIPLIAKRSILAKIEKWKHFGQLIPIEKAPFSLKKLNESFLSDPVHEAYFLEADNFRLIYAPHGARLKHLPQADLLITTTTTYKLPFWLGGTINLGSLNALKMQEKCKAKWLVTTHDEQKKGSGLVERLARKTYADGNGQWIELLSGQERIF